jgi:hypothetical protein
MPSSLPHKREWVYGDFNGMLDRDLLCLSHEDTAKRQDGSLVVLAVGMALTAFDEDLGDDGGRDDLFVSGIVETSPQEAQCRGSKWSLRINGDGFRHESDLNQA